jgi:hypothetical protein
LVPSVADKRFVDEVLMYPELGPFIGGKWKMAHDVSHTEDVIDPPTCKSLSVKFISQA